MEKKDLVNSSSMKNTANDCELMIDCNGTLLFLGMGEIIKNQEDQSPSKIVFQSRYSYSKYQQENPTSTTSTTSSVHDDEFDYCQYAHDYLPLDSEKYCTLFEKSNQKWFVKVYNGWMYIAVTNSDYPSYLGAEIVDVLSNIHTSSTKSESNEEIVENKNPLQRMQQTSQKWLSSFKTTSTPNNTTNTKIQQQEDLVLFSDTKIETEESTTTLINDKDHPTTGIENPQSDDKEKNTNIGIKDDDPTTPTLSTTKTTATPTIGKKNQNDSIQNLGNTLLDWRKKVSSQSESIHRSIQSKLASLKDQQPKDQVSNRTNNNTACDAGCVDIQLSLDEYCKAVFCWYVSLANKESAVYESHNQVIDIMYQMNHNIQALLSSSSENQERQESICKSLCQQSKIFKDRTKSVRNKKAERIATFGKVAAVGSLAVFGIGGLILAGPELAVASMFAGEMVETSALALLCGAWYKVTQDSARQCWFWSQPFIHHHPSENILAKTAEQNQK